MLCFNQPSRPIGRFLISGVLIQCALLVGCGATVTRKGTEQLLVSDAVDRCVSQLDFSVLANRTVFFDTKYIVATRSPGFVNSQYIISALRERLVGAGCQLQDSEKDAEYVVEARVGALGNDAHEVTYGIPASNTLNAAATLITSTPTLPTVPEIAFAKKNDQSAAAKIAVFAYHRESRRAVWQSGLSEARSTARDLWVLGAGPFQRGSIYSGTQFAGHELPIKTARSGHVSMQNSIASARVIPQRIFHTPAELESEIQQEKERLIAEKAAKDKAEVDKQAIKLASEKKSPSKRARNPDKKKTSAPIAKKPPATNKSTASASSGHRPANRSTLSVSGQNGRKPSKAGASQVAG